MTTAKERGQPLATEVARELGLVPTDANLDNIHRAIEREAQLVKVAAKEVAEMLIRAGKECVPLRVSDCKDRDTFKLNTINRFWFEDSRYRTKPAYLEFRKRHWGGAC